MKIHVNFLGTGDAMPTARRNHSAFLVSYADENILIDCGEGTQRQFRKAGLNPCRITRLLITHWHGDHILGIPGLLQTLGLSGYNRKLRIYGPKGTGNFMRRIFDMFIYIGKLDYEINEINSGKVFETKEFYVEAKPMLHGANCLAYAIVEKDKLRIDKKKLKKLKLPASPLIGKLQKGEDIIFNGKKIRAKDVSYLQKGRKIAFILDTGYNENAVEIARNADALIIESSFSKEEKEQAERYKHLTAEQAARIAKKARVKNLILTHVSQRYEKNMKKIELEAKKIFRNTKLAKDFDKIEV